MDAALPYARRLVKARIDEDLIRPPFVKPFLRFGEFAGLASYFLQLGALLASLHRENLDAFGAAFLGLSDAAEGTMADALAEVDSVITASMTFSDFVCAQQSRRRGFGGPPEQFLVEHKSLKILAGDAEETAMDFAQYGAVLGAMRPDTALRLFANTHAPASCRGSAPTEKDRLAYDLVAKSESDIFRAYCRQSFPELFVELNH